MPMKYGIVFLLLLAAVSVASASPNVVRPPAFLPITRLPITSIDTMKESRDSDTNPLSTAQIQDDITVSSQLHPTYITIDTFYDYPQYMERWIQAVRAAHKHVWFRCCFNAWEGNNGVPAVMTPLQYTQALTAFIAAHSGIFQSGDILDPLPEPENGKYWARTSPYGKEWSWKNAPNATTDEFNQFFLALPKAADAALIAHGVQGVITWIRSTNGWIAARPTTLYPATVAALGCITTDSYVGQSPTITPEAALTALKSEIEGIERLRHVPLVIGEFGYSIQALVGDRQQAAVLQPQLMWLCTRPYLLGVNYWHGAGYKAPDTYNGSRLFMGTTGRWALRPAAYDLADFFRSFSEYPRHLSYPSIFGGTKLGTGRSVFKGRH